MQKMIYFPNNSNTVKKNNNHNALLRNTTLIVLHDCCPYNDKNVEVQFFTNISDKHKVRPRSYQNFWRLNVKSLELDKKNHLILR